MSLKSSIYHRYINYVKFNYRSKVVSYLYKFSIKTLQAFFNSSEHDFESNGERVILDKISSYYDKYGDLIIFDVGANIGEWSALASKIMPGSSIHLFEIVPQTYSICYKNLNMFANITLNKFGLSNEEKEVEIKYYPSSNTGSSAYDFPWSVDSELIKARVLTGSSYCETNSINRIHFLKIDVEGDDLNVIKGFEDLIKANKVDIIQFEYGKVAVFSKSLLRDFYDFLAPHNFVIGRVHPDSVAFKEYDIFVDENLFQGNFIAVNKLNCPNLISQLS